MKAAPETAAGGSRGETLPQRYERIRTFTESLCVTLEPEDCVVQSMPDVSPTRWHLAHTSWFFETFLLRPHLEGYHSPDDRYNLLFNSYYNLVGEQHPRPDRGLISRPTVAEVYAYRHHVDAHMERLLSGAGGSRIAPDAMAALVEIGLNHEQQHQELMLTDIKHVFSCNPLRPAFRVPAGDEGPAATGPATAPGAGSPGWVSYDEGIRHIGHEGGAFAYDNEGPRHRVFLEPFRLADRLVTAGEYREFIADGGYHRSDLWLDAGWAVVNARGWKTPLYWEERDGAWQQFTLQGMRPVDDNEPVAHVSYYEADAYARWAGRRLPTEFEWECAAAEVAGDGNFVDNNRFHPLALAGAPQSGVPSQLFGDVWEWTMSHYSPYPGYRPAPGAIGEYNGKWMCNQFVLRGGSCATSRDHIRRTYRNFFPADARWQFSGIRLADDG